MPYTPQAAHSVGTSGAVGFQHVRVRTLLRGGCLPCPCEPPRADVLDDEYGADGGAAAGLDAPASLKAELWSDEESSGEEPEDEEFGALEPTRGASGAGAPWPARFQRGGSAPPLCGST